MIWVVYSFAVAYAHGLLKRYIIELTDNRMYSSFKLLSITFDHIHVHTGSRCVASTLRKIEHSLNF